MFTKLFFGEVKKLVRPKGLLTISVLLLVFFIIFAIAYNVNMQSMFDEMVGENGVSINKTTYLKDVVNVDNIDLLIEKAQQDYQDSKKLKYPITYQAKANLNVLKYIKANNLFDTDILIKDMDFYAIKSSAESFVSLYGSVVATILMIYMLVMASGSYADEYNDGTIKLLMLRPITRSQLTTAKLLALISWATVLFSSVYAVAYLYGLIAYGGQGGAKLLMCFNATTPFIATRGLDVFIQYLSGLLQIIIMLTLGYAVGTMTRKKTFGIISGLIVMFGVVSLPLKYLHADRFLLSSSSNLGAYFGIGGSMEGMNFYLALGMVIIYVTALILSTYAVTNKRDIV